MSFLLDTLLDSFQYFIFIAFLILVSYASANTLPARTAKADRWVFIWLIFDALVHLTMEAMFVWLSIGGNNVEGSTGFMADLWKEYSKADSRWAIADPTIVAIEAITAVFCGPLCLVVALCIHKKHPWRHVWQVVLVVCELYGGYMTFFPEVLSGSSALNTTNPVYKYVYLIFFNGLWVVIPLLLLWQSAQRIAHGDKLLHSKEYTKQQ
ncbi:uncharacterized protein VTP21DRAFT_7025 [Calcarisporiella thermophila]|uniref:uncharacterized protein n=1 Tax=Calcarisporiella thermophila TaxID=911321 RepID=UPI003742BC95